jgi:competence protein CoiA
MQYARDQAGQRVKPQHSGELAVCECCGSEVHAKCGVINAWHWAHRVVEDCDVWSEPITEWHLGWQRYLEDHHDAEIEVPMRRGAQVHRADAQLPSGIVIELQHSAISVDEMAQREQFYGVDRMVWLFDARDAYREKRLDLRDRGTFHSFRWKHPRKVVAYARAPVRLDLGAGLILTLKRMHAAAPCGGWGILRYHPELDHDAGAW